MVQIHAILGWLNNKLVGLANWIINTQTLRSQMLLSRHGVKFDKDGNVIGARTYVD